MNAPRSRLVLGTVQLGMQYGLANKTGQSSREESFAILDRALNSGINTFDTAWAYGEAEDVLGEWIVARSLARKIYIVSKMKPHVLNDYPDGEKASDIVQYEIEKTLRRLHADRIDGYLFHSPHYVYLEHAVRGLLKIKDSGLVSHVGVSVYDEPEALQALASGLDYIQIPYNIFDKRFEQNGFSASAKKQGARVFARSPFLQGLLVMRPDEVPEHLAYARPYLEQLQAILKRHHVGAVEASLLFSYCRSSAGHVVFGVETSGQLDEILEIEQKAKIAASSEWMRALDQAFDDMPRAIVNPSVWTRATLVV